MGGREKWQKEIYVGGKLCKNQTIPIIFQVFCSCKAQKHLRLFETLSQQRYWLVLYTSWWKYLLVIPIEIQLFWNWSYKWKSIIIFPFLILCQARKLAQESTNRVDLSKPLLLLFNKFWHTNGSSSEGQKQMLCQNF